MTTQAPAENDKSPEKYKFLYELSRKALDEEVDRYKRLDEKAGRFLSAISIAIIAFTALLKEGQSYVCGKPDSLMEWAYIVLAGLTYLAFLTSWFRYFSAMKLIPSPRVTIGEHSNELIANHDLATVYEQHALSCQNSVRLARSNLKDKTKHIQMANEETMLAVALLSILFLIQFFAHYFGENCL